VCWHKHLAWKFRKGQFLANELLLLYYMIGIIVFVTPAPVFFILLEIDPVTSILSDLFLPHPFYHNFFHIISTAIISLYAFAFGFYTTYKQIGVYITFGTAFGIVLTSVLSNFEELSKNSSPRKVLQGYCTFRVIFKTVDILTSENTVTLLMWSLMAFSLCPWLYIRCFKILPLFIVLAALAATLGGVGLTLVIMQLLIGVHLKSIDFVKSQRACYFTFNRSKGNYYCTRKWKAQQPLRLTCGGYFPLSENVIMVYLSILSTNVCNAVLLVKP